MADAASGQRQLQRLVAEADCGERSTLMRPMANEDNGHWSASVVLKQHANVEQDFFY